MKAKRIVSLMLAFSMAVGLTACGGEAGEKAEKEDGKVSITVFSEWVGAHPYAKYFAERVESFEEAHPEIDVNVEEIAGSTTANMDAKLKVQVSSGELPDVFYTNDQSIIDLAKKSNLLYDFKDKLDADAELKDELDMEDIASWNEGSDQVYGICSHKDFFGFFYNKEILKAAGYEKFPESWDELYDLCEKLKGDGVAAMALETKTAWYSSLTLLAALASGSEKGQEMAKTVGLTDYNTPEFIEAASQLQKMFMEYSTTDAPGSDISVALNNFTSDKTAIVLDGAWRIAELTEAMGDKVGEAYLPGKGAVSYPGYAWFSGSKDEKTAAVSYEFIKWFNNKEDQAIRLEQLGLIPASANIDYESLELSPLMMEILEMKDDVNYTVSSCWRVYPAAVTAIIPQELAALGTGQSTPEQFAENLTKASN